jgi:transcriptional antiterminator NusG
MWYVIWTFSGKEERLRSAIEKNVPSDAYNRCAIPKRKIKKRIRGKWESVEQRLFPSYVFVETEDIGRFNDELKKIHGFSVILHNEDDYYCPLSRDEKHFLLSLIGLGETVEESIGIKKGSEIVVISGPLVGMEGQIRKIDRHKRIAILEMELFSRKTEVKVSLELLDKKI